MNGIVFDIKRYAIHDGPGIRTTVFLKGCPLRCPWCQNPESQGIHPQLSLTPDYCIGCGDCIRVCANNGIQKQGDSILTDRIRCIHCGECVNVCPSQSRSIVGENMSVSQVMEEIGKDRVFYDESGGGVTFSGGEPLMQADFLLACLESCKRQGYHTTVDTCGFAPPEVFFNVGEHTDLFLYDLKIMDNTRHQELLQASNEFILNNLQELCEQGKTVWIRVPLIPGINDDQENIAAIADFASNLRTKPRIQLLPYHRIGDSKYNRLELPKPAETIIPPSKKHTHHIAEQFQASGLTVTIGG